MDPADEPRGVGLARAGGRRGEPQHTARSKPLQIPNQWCILLCHRGLELSDVAKR